MHMVVLNNNLRRVIAIRKTDGHFALIIQGEIPVTREKEKAVTKERQESREAKHVDTWAELQSRKAQYEANRAYGFKLTRTQVDGGLTHNGGQR
jgi:hypothetical protein